MESIQSAQNYALSGSRTDVQKPLPNGTMAGSGLKMEGYHQGPVFSNLCMSFTNNFTKYYFYNSVDLQNNFFVSYFYKRIFSCSL